MTNEEILKAAQANASKEGEAEVAILRRAIAISAIVSIVVCMVTFIIKIILHKIDFLEFVILLLFDGTINLYYRKKCRLKRKMIAGIIGLVLGGLAFLLFLGAMFV